MDSDRMVKWLREAILDNDNVPDHSMLVLDGAGYHTKKKLFWSLIPSILNCRQKFLWIILTKPQLEPQAPRNGDPSVRKPAAEGLVRGEWHWAQREEWHRVDAHSPRNPAWSRRHLRRSDRLSFNGLTKRTADWANAIELIWRRPKAPREKRTWRWIDLVDFGDDVSTPEASRSEWKTTKIKAIQTDWITNW